MGPAELYAAHLRVLQRFVYFRMPTRADADDVLQETALAVLSAKDAPADAEKGKAWLLGIARHKCADWFRRAHNGLPLETLFATPAEPAYTHTHAGLDIRDCLEGLSEADRQVLALHYLEDRPQADIARQLGIPTGTVKSRLHTAKARFREQYDNKGELSMKKELPLILPEYTIEPIPLSPFEVRCEELYGWFAVPRLGEKLRWGLYDLPERKRTEYIEMEAVGRASVHGIEGVELTARVLDGQDEDPQRTLITQLTDTHVRYLAESHVQDGLRRCYTFLDGDAFLKNWGFGEDNCGREIDLKPKGLIAREGDTLTLTAQSVPFMDVVGRYAVTINGRRYDTICLIMPNTCNNIYNKGCCSEQFIDQNGRTVLWRRFNPDNWRIERYGMPWTERLPENERLTINGETYVHWYDCITEYVI